MFLPGPGRRRAEEERPEGRRRGRRGGCLLGLGNAVGRGGLRRSRTSGGSRLAERGQRLPMARGREGQRLPRGPSSFRQRPAALQKEKTVRVYRSRFLVGGSRYPHLSGGEERESGLASRGTCVAGRWGQLVLPEPSRLSVSILLH